MFATTKDPLLNKILLCCGELAWFSTTNIFSNLHKTFKIDIPLLPAQKTLIDQLVSRGCLQLSFEFSVGVPLYRRVKRVTVEGDPTSLILNMFAESLQGTYCAAEVIFKRAKRTYGRELLHPMGSEDISTVMYWLDMLVLRQRATRISSSVGEDLYAQFLPIIVRDRAPNPRRVLKSGHYPHCSRSLPAVIPLKPMCPLART